MPIYQSKLDTRTDTYKQNREQQLVAIDYMQTLNQRAQAASEKRRARFEARGQLTPRERLAQLLDPGLPFLALYNMAGYCVDDPDPETSIPGASILAGIGYINGVRCMCHVDDSGISAGAATELSFRKGYYLLKMALEKKLPYIHLVESAGVNLSKYKVESWVDAGKLYYLMARMSAAGVPCLTVLHGPSTAGGAYMPGMSDYNIGVKKNGMAALGGAALVEAATGEIADERELGGTEMHAHKTGLIEYLAENDIDGIAQMRALVKSLDWNAHCPHAEQVDYKEPLYDAEDILGLVPVDYKIPYEMRELAARLVDGSDFIDFKPNYGASIVCLQAKIFNQAVGIIGNNGPINPAGATKAAHFIQLCDQADIPLVFLNNITGYLIGTEYEQDGIIKHGAKMIQAVANTHVPKLSFYIGGSFGAGNYGMAGFGYEPDFLFTWPAAQTGVMGGEQAADTMAHVGRRAAKRRDEKIDEKALARQRADIEALFQKQISAFYTSGRLLDHGMIDPRDTRKIIGFALQTCWEAKHRKLNPNKFGVARL